MSACVGGVGVAVMVAVGVIVGVADGVDVKVGVTVDVDVGVTVAVSVGVIVDVAVGVTVSVAVGAIVSVAVISTVGSIVGSTPSPQCKIPSVYESIPGHETGRSSPICISMPPIMAGTSCGIVGWHAARSRHTIKMSFFILPPNCPQIAAPGLPTLGR